MSELKDPRLQELTTVFPSIDAGVIGEVWQSRQAEGGEGWVERVTEDLLTLSDPAYKPEPRQVHTVDAATQSALDEEFARSLSMGDDHAHHLPYTPRSRRPHPHQQDAPSLDATYAYRGGSAQTYPSGAAEGGIEEKIEKFAEAGKQKLDFLLSRAREKYADMSEAAAQAQAQRLQQQHEQGGHSLAQGGKGFGDNPPQGLGYELANTLGGLWTGATAAVRTAAPIGGQARTGAGGESSSSTQPVWNDGAAKLTAGLGSAASGLKGWFDGARTAVAARPTGQEAHPSATPETRQSTGTAPYRRWQPTDTYEGETAPRSINVYPSSSASSASSLPSTSDDDEQGKLDDARDSTPRATSHLAGGVPHVPVAGANAVSPPGKIDLSKIGMLPKKKVALVSSPDATSSTATLTAPQGASGIKQGDVKQGDVQEEEEEYTKNPFEER